jgi:hypothetical protein
VLEAADSSRSVRSALNRAMAISGCCAQSAGPKLRMSA